jgi:hypothetical protein
MNLFGKTHDKFAELPFALIAKPGKGVFVCYFPLLALCRLTEQEFRASLWVQFSRGRARTNHLSMLSFSLLLPARRDTARNQTLTKFRPFIGSQNF